MTSTLSIPTEPRLLGLILEQLFGCSASSAWAGMLLMPDPVRLLSVVCGRSGWLLCSKDYAVQRVAVRAPVPANASGKRPSPWAILDRIRRSQEIGVVGSHYDLCGYFLPPGARKIMKPFDHDRWHVTESDCWLRASNAVPTAATLTIRAMNGTSRPGDADSPLSGRLEEVLPRRCIRPRFRHLNRSSVPGSMLDCCRQHSMAGSQERRIRLPG